MNKLLWGLAAAVGMNAAAVSDTLYVDDDAPLDGDGLSWDSAYRYLQDALFEASNNLTINEIRLAQGLYPPDRDEGGNITLGDREATFYLLNGVAILGGHAGIGAEDPDERNVSLFETVLTGDLLGNDDPKDFPLGLTYVLDNSFHVVTSGGTDNTAILDGFTITGGSANPMAPIERGGAIYNDAGSPTINHCVFSFNSASDQGGAIDNSGAESTISSCTFVNNVVTSTVGPGIGGAIANRSCAVILVDCNFNANEAPQNGGAVVVESGTVVIANCTFNANEARFNGGAIYLLLSECVITDCSFSNNSVTDSTGQFGGAIFASSSAISVSESTFSGNSVSGISNSGGGAVMVIDAPATFRDCEFVGNSAVLSGGAIAHVNFDLTPLDGVVLT